MVSVQWRIQKFLILGAEDNKPAQGDLLNKMLRPIGEMAAPAPLLFF